MKELPPVTSVAEWKQKERLLQTKENAYVNSFNDFQRLIDNHLTFVILLSVSGIISFSLGFILGLFIKV